MNDPVFKFDDRVTFQHGSVIHQVRYTWGGDRFGAVFVCVRSTQSGRTQTVTANRLRRVEPGVSS